MSDTAIVEYVLTRFLFLRSITQSVGILLLDKSMTPSQRHILFSFLAGFLLLLPVRTYARHKMGSQLSSSFGLFSATSNWQIQAPAASTVNGVSVLTSIICPPSQGSDGTGSTVITGPLPANQKICIAGRYVFVYQISALPSDSVFTFSGLAGFAFDPSSAFGVVRCDSTAAVNPPCTNLSQAQVDALNLGFDALGGDLIVTIPQIASGTPLTLFIQEQFPDFQSSDVNFPNQIPTVPTTPSLNIGGAIVSPATPHFGSQEVGTTSAPVIITIANTPDFASSINIMNLSTSADFAAVGDCPASSSIASGKQCAFALSFSPSAVGSASGTFNVADNSPPGHEIVSVGGSGNTAGVSFSPTLLFFGTLVTGTVSTKQSITITNSSGPNPFTFHFPTVNNSQTGTPDFSPVDHCGGSVAVGTNCQVDITFNPSFPGSLSQAWTIADNSVEKSHTIELSGTAIDPQLLDVSGSPESLDFGSQLAGTSSAALTYSFVNNTGGALTVEVVSTSAEFALASETCTGAPVSAGNSCSAQVTFTPTMGGPINGSLTIADHAINGSLIVPLSGTGQDFVLSATSSSASTAQGGTANYNLSLTPEGGFTGTIQISCTGAPLEATFTSCPSSLNVTNSSSAAIAVSIKTTAAVVCGVFPSWPAGRPKNEPLLLLWMTLFCLLFLLFLLAFSTYRARRVLLASVVVIIGVACVSCGGGTPVVNCNPDSGTPLGHANLSVTASSGNTQHAITLDLNVTQ
jgi:hypothetical protein